MGFIYALVGIEYTLIWNASGVLNFSHDKLITLGAYIFGGTYIIGLGMGYVPGNSSELDYGGADWAGDCKGHIYSASEYDNDLYNYGYSHVGKNYY